ncbi:D-alanine--D-alanine ligase A [uncultured Pleomorphomonas sp.]|uniref:D-alanine--D-alanine ligase n=1 Tax=uncultured Pleomorphomonas sp. TaxID=442121 RepID=A0A212LM47_9HYPH|nr:D-alanine--D-alanine ligase family protein [uncultured Pleomorphomonas sp.]SCM78607.1 D-alanine--D-alanine ligase A [uncultured Pleomorphomonas sp.]
MTVSETIKPRIAVLFGGRSAEHEVSVMSAENVMRAIDPVRYEAVPIYIDRQGVWRLSALDGGRLARPEAGARLALVPGGGGRLVALPDAGAAYDLPSVDLIFPVLHGQNGEDGSLQGLARVARLPLVGCDILGSAATLDKDVAKRLLRDAGLPVARWVAIRRDAVPAFDGLARHLGLPLFVKPASQGSSVGVSKVSTEAEFQAALAEGFKYDRKLLAEEFVGGREIECAVLEDADGVLSVSRPGEIVPAARHGFYSYDAKYIDADGAELKVPADLPADLERMLRDTAGAAFRATGCDGWTRVDFFVTADGRFLVNELNTIPGCTDISMYPLAMAASGVPMRDVVDRLVRQALARHAAADGLGS